MEIANSMSELLEEPVEEEEEVHEEQHFLALGLLFFLTGSGNS